ncbi:MAG: hypothetical protein HYX77_02825 [Acidobacteria bacterium]|nr:hypothetical protein [Acidobacteriota bacterium]
MRQLVGLLLAGGIVLLPAFSQGHGTVFAQAAPQKTTFTGEMVVWAFAVNADKTADYEQVVAKLKDALSKSERPEAKQQLAGWKVMKNAAPQPDGSVLYIHVISPVVPDADYSIVNIVYEVFKEPAEQQAFYDAYRGSLKAALFLVQGSVTHDFSK